MRDPGIWTLCLAAAVVLGGCGDDPVDPASDGSVARDASVAPDAEVAVVCAADGECDDGLYCTGVERCVPGGDEAGADGCVAGEPPCDAAAGESCDEASGACVAGSCEGDMADLDGDGDDRIECGGSDCDDSDDRVYGTAQEVCDPGGLDEDCDPSTIHDSVARDGDEDGDGYVSTACFNPRPGGGENRGDDCDDARPTINPDGVEACDGRDNDCDTRIDEDVLETYYRDVDGDNFGDSTMTMMDCTAPTGWVLRDGDCEDRDASVHPAATETCNGVDDNCSGTADDPPEGCACRDGMERDCGPLDRYAGVGICRRSTQRCVSGSWPMECPGAVYPRTNSSGDAYDPCGMGDEDCDGTTDEDGRVAFYRDTDGDGFGDPTMRMDFCPGDEGSMYVMNDRDCDDDDDRIRPTAMEICDAIDNNCSGIVDDVAGGGCGCLSGETRSCGTDVGRCSFGTQTCTPSGTWGTCTGGTVSRPEACNGLDDDCDGPSDEDFDCVQGDTATGPTACGNPGTRMCTATCGWATPDFHTAESASTCDYCDDSGMGLRDELAFATGMSTASRSTGFDLYGDANLRFVIPEVPVLADEDGDRGAAVDPTLVTLGYGSAYVQATVRTTATRDNPRDGTWSLLLLHESATRFVDSSHSSGLPSEPGLAVTWNFYSLCGTFLCTYDSLFLNRLSTGGGTGLGSAPAPGANQDGPAGTSVMQTVILELTPDDPRTAVDESAAAVFAPAGTGLRCANDGSATACGLTLTPGSRYWLGAIGAASSPIDVEIALPELQRTVYGVCP